MTPFIPPELQPAFKEGANARIDEMLGAGKKNWFSRKWVSLYGMGQNFGMIVAWKLGLRESVNWWERHKDENCSSFWASVFGCGFEVLKRPVMWIFEELGIRETAGVAPCHYLMSGKFAIVKPGERIRDFYIILHLNWGELKYKNIDEVLAELKRQLSLLKFFKNPIKMVKQVIDFWKAFDPLLSEGIRITQRDYFHAPDPSWRITHTEGTRRVISGDATIVEQQAFVSEHRMTETAIWQKITGDRPDWIVLRPLFLYGEA